MNRGRGKSMGFSCSVRFLCLNTLVVPDRGVGSGIKVLILTPQNPKPWGTSPSPAVRQRDVSGAACPGCAVQLLQGCSFQKTQAPEKPEL